MVRAYSGLVVSFDNCVVIEN